MSNSGFTFTRVKDQMIQQLLDMGIKDFRVLDALSQVPRHIFWIKHCGVERMKIEHLPLGISKQFLNLILLLA